MPNKNGRFAVYSLIDPRNGKARYIGKSADPVRRLKSHIGSASKGGKAHRDNWIRQLINSGLEPILKIEYDFLTEKRAFALERHLIKEFRRRGEKLTNETDGGEGGDTFTGNERAEEHRMKISAALKGRINGPLSAEHRRKISTAHIGMHPSPEARAAQSRAQIGRIPWNKGKKIGRYHTRKQNA